MGRFLVEFAFPALILITGWTQVVGPIIRRKPLFPLARTVVSNLLGKPDSAKALLESATERERAAKLRHIAAEKDAHAASLEAEAEKLEDEAFKKRTE